MKKYSKLETLLQLLSKEVQIVQEKYFGKRERVKKGADECCPVALFLSFSGPILGRGLKFWVQACFWEF